MNEQELGMVAEIEFKKRAVSNGFIISKVLNDRGGYDFIVDCGDRLTKVQVKSTSYLEMRGSNPSYSLAIKKRKHGSKTLYDKDDYDFLAIYIHGPDMMYIVPIAETSGNMRIYVDSKKSKYNKYKDAWNLFRI